MLYVCYPYVYYDCDSVAYGLSNERRLCGIVNVMDWSKWSWCLCANMCMIYVLCRVTYLAKAYDLVV